MVKSYDELTIQDNFIFQKIMRNKRICKQTLERLLNIDIKDISYPEEEKTMDGHAPADDFTKEIDSEVVVAKNREEWRREYMTLALEIEKEKKKAVEERNFAAAIEMLKDNLPVEKVAKYTSLTIDQIKEIGKKNALL